MVREVTIQELTRSLESPDRRRGFTLGHAQLAQTRKLETRRVLDLHDFLEQVGRILEPPLQSVDLRQTLQRRESLGHLGQHGFEKRPCLIPLPISQMVHGLVVAEIDRRSVDSSRPIEVSESLPLFTEHGMRRC